MIYLFYLAEGWATLISAEGYFWLCSGVIPGNTPGPCVVLMAGPDPSKASAFTSILPPFSCLMWSCVALLSVLPNNQSQTERFLPPHLSAQGSSHSLDTEPGDDINSAFILLLVLVWDLGPQKCSGSHPPVVPGGTLWSLRSNSGPHMPRICPTIPELPPPTKFAFNAYGSRKTIFFFILLEVPLDHFQLWSLLSIIIFSFGLKYSGRRDRTEAGISSMQPGQPQS